MAGPVTVPDFLGVVRQSGLLEASVLGPYLNRLRQAGTLPERAEALAALLVRDGILTRFQAEQLLAGKVRGFVIGRYRVLDKIGAGGTGMVFLARHTQMDRRVALKILPTDRSDDPVARGRFRREAQAVAALNHPNIVRAYDIDLDAEPPFFVMEFVDGVSLQELVARQGRLEVGQAVDYARQTAAALEHAHQAGLVHRDVKPANLLVTADGVVKLLDLGLARFHKEEDDGLTERYEQGAVLGTVDYLAPEQAQNCHAADIRADVYALGGTLFFLLTGQPPFAGGTLRQKLIWHQIKPAPPVTEARPEVPAGLAAVVARMLAKEPGERFQTPAEVIRALRPWSARPLPEPADEGPPSTRTRRGSATVPDFTLAEAAGPAVAVAPPPPQANLPPQPLPLRGEGVTTVPAPPSLAAEGAAGGRDVAATRRRLPWLLAGAGVLVVVGLGLWGLLRSSGSAPVQETTPPPAGPLTPPTRLRAAALSSGVVELTWQGGGAAAGFKIEGADDAAAPDAAWSLVDSTRAGTTRYDKARLVPGKPVYYRVRAVGVDAASAPSNVAWPAPAYRDGFGGAGLVLNGGAAVKGKVLHLTDGPKQTRSAWFCMPQDVRAFRTAFRFRLGAGDQTADGFTFCVQRVGPSALGGENGGLGFEGIGEASAAVKFDLWDNQGEGKNSTGLFTGGKGPYKEGNVDLTPSGVDLHSGRTYEARLAYAGGKLELTVQDVAEPTKTFRGTFAVDLPAVVGGPRAYVGFTAAAGNGVVQDILDWTWTPQD